MSEIGDSNVMPSEVASSGDKNTGNALKYTTKISDLQTLKNYLAANTPSDILNSFTVGEERTSVHDACDCADKKLSRALVNKILSWYGRHKHQDKNKIKFVDKQDILGNTALHYALKRKNGYAVRELINCGADLNLRNKEQVEPIVGIYQQFPKSINALISSKDGERDSIEFEEDEDDENEDNLTVTCNFSMITGIGNDPSEISETYMLSNVFRLGKYSRVEILTNPVVQLFLDLKWSKMKWFIYASVLFHIFWSIISHAIIMNIFMTKYGNFCNTTEQFERMGGNGYDFNTRNILSSILLVITTLFITAKEIFEIMSSPTLCNYLKQAENWGQWLLILTIYLLHINILLEWFPVWLDYNLSIVAVVTSCLLVLGQFNKHPELGIYMEMYMKGLKRFRTLLIWFCPTLFAFASGFHMLMPTDEKFALPWGIVKKFAMLTGELNFDGIYANAPVAVMIPKNVLLLTFIIFVPIVLTNLLLALVVSDVEELKKKARENNLGTQLEQMYLMEAFIIKWLPQNVMEVCMLTKNKSAMMIWPLCLLQPFWEKVIKNCVFLFIFGPQEPLDFNMVEPHIVTRKLKYFSKECRIILRRVRKERDAEIENKPKSD